jgi:hypothetical protein
MDLPSSRWHPHGAAFSATVTPQAAHATEPVTLQLEAKIPLGDVKGRIDHKAMGRYICD